MPQATSDGPLNGDSFRAAMATLPLPLQKYLCAASAASIAETATMPLDVMKCWGRGTQLMMHDGTAKKVEDIVRDSQAGIAQLLMGDDSTPRAVQPGSAIVHRGAMHRVTSNNQTHRSWTCNSGHILVLKIHAGPRVHKCARSGSSWHVSWFDLALGADDIPSGQRSYTPVELSSAAFSTSQLAEQFRDSLRWEPLHFECTVRDYLAAKPHPRAKCLMYQPDLVCFPTPALNLKARLSTAVKQHGAADLEVTDALVEQTAWVLGMWIADACLKTSHTDTTRALESWHGKVSSASSGDVLSSLLHSYGAVMAKKMVPSELLCESPEVRKSLLTGIIDGAGHYNHRSVCYTVTANDSQVLEQYRHLVRGLGFTTLTSKESKDLTMNFGGAELSSLATVLQSKRCPGVKLQRDLRADGFSIAPSRAASFYGFELDGNRRCLLSDFVVTHNTRMQLDTTPIQQTASSTQVATRRGLLATGRFIYDTEGFKRLYLGLTPAVLRQALVGGIGVGLYPQIKDLLVHVKSGSAQNQSILTSLQSFSPAAAAAASADHPLSFGTKVVAGAISGIIGQLIAAPTCVVKVRMQADARLEVPRYSGTYHALVTIPRAEGFRALFSGIVPSLQRAAVMYGATISTYDHVKHAVVDQLYHGDTRAMDFVSTHLAASSVSGLAASAVSAPFDTIKTRIISQAVQPRKSILGITPLLEGPHAPPSGVLYSSTIDCVVKTVRAEGFLAIYKGLVPCYARLAPWQLTFFVAFEQLSLALTGQSLR